MIKLSAPRLFAVAGALGMMLAPVLPRAETVASDISVVELFTSQGCSSCPAADKLLQRLARRPDLIALSYPVTYWDYLGWKDTLARPENTERQRSYAAARGDGQVYTPQAVVNGLEDCVGSDLAAIESAVETTASVVRRDSVSLKARLESGKIIIETGEAPPSSRHRTGKIWIVAVQRSATVPIVRGENAGHTVTYTNVVRHLTEAGEWHGTPTSYALPISEAMKDGDMAVVFLQAEGLGPIVASARIGG